MRKAFSQELLDQYDSKAKYIVKKFFEEQGGFSLVINPDKYGIDLISPNGIGVEVEVKNNWGDTKFPFPDIHIPERKKPLVNGKNIFIVLNKDCNRMAIISSKDMQTIVNKNTSYTEKEDFYSIPIDKVKFIKI
jgi:hypothetical protein